MKASQALGFCVGIAAFGWVNGVMAAPPEPPPPAPPPVQVTAPPAPTLTPPPPPTGDTGAAAAAAPKTIDQRRPSSEVDVQWGFSSGNQAGPNYVKPEKEVALIINPVGYYQGVTVEGANAPPFAPQSLGSTPAVLTWTGFERTLSGSRVFFQISSAVQPELTTEPGSVKLRLTNTSVNVRNNQRRLDTRFFKTPVTDVVLGRSGADTVITLTLRRPATPQWSVRDGTNGYKLLVVEFADETMSDPAASTVGTPPPAPPVQ